MATKLVWIPRPIAMFITTLQLSQMVVGMGVQVVLWRNLDNPSCKTSRNHVLAGTAMYGSYSKFKTDWNSAKKCWTVFDLQVHGGN